MFLLISQTGNSWIVQYVIGLLNHLLIYSSQHFLYFKMNLLVENTMWDSMKVEQIFYNALDGSACQALWLGKHPASIIHIILGHCGLQGTQALSQIISCEGWHLDRSSGWTLWLAVIWVATRSTWKMVRLSCWKQPAPPTLPL